MSRAEQRMTIPPMTRMMVAGRTAALSIACAVLFGCGTTAAPETARDRDTGEEVADDASELDSRGAGDAAFADAETGTHDAQDGDASTPDVDTDLPPDAAAICRPAPPEWPIRDELPDRTNALRALDDACPLLGIERAVPSSLQERWSFEVVGPGEVIATQHRGRELPFRINRWQFSSDGELLGVREEIGIDRDAVTTIDRQWDELGRLLEYQRSFEADGGRTGAIHVINSWDGELLASRNVERDGVQSVFRWEYDSARRFVGATVATTDGQRARVRFTFDAQGRPVRASRELQERELLIQRWSWGAEDELLERAIEVVGPGIDGLREGLRAGSIGYIAGLDDFEPAAWRASFDHDRFNDNPWPGAIVRRRGDCRMPPISHGHGYPDAEPYYYLGWPVGERPGAIGFAYEYDGFGWAYGDRAWYGHSGVASPWFDVDPMLAPLQWTATYHDGRLVAEQGTMPLRSDTESEASLDRIRRYDGDLLIDDTMAYLGPAGQRLERSLRFRYDDAGRITRRELAAGSDLYEVQTWRWHRTGQVEEHAVRVQPGLRHAGLIDPAPPTPSPLREPVLSATYLREFDDAGRLIMQNDRMGDEPGCPTRYSYDDRGRRVRKVVCPTDDGTAQAIETWEYDGEHLVRHALDSGGDGFEESVWRWEYDPDGRLLLHAFDSGTGRASWEMRYSWGCR